jgi:hypothetical protein
LHRIFFVFYDVDLLITLVTFVLVYLKEVTLCVVNCLVFFVGIVIMFIFY